eukprot:15289780-Alexandrium_andersonii.AAC.1
MSASLVGSEMCIRDSNCRAYGSLAASVLQQCLAVSPALRSRSSVSSVLACLLYTSDAADDM